MTTEKQTSGRRLINKVLRAFMGELRAILKRRAPAYYAQFPRARRPCHTCAFNPSTDRMTGWDTTALHLMEAIRDGTGFMCHENIPWRKPLSEWTPEEIQRALKEGQICGGFAAIAGDPKTREAFVVAALQANGRKPCQQAINLAMSAVEGAGSVLR